MIKTAVKNLSGKFQQLEIKRLNISDYGKDYLLKYSGSFQFYMSMYSQLMDKALIKLKKPIRESTFIDYGGGLGLLSFLAKEIGFGTVVYNDLNQIRVDEAEVISKMINCTIDHFVHGDIEDLINDLNQNEIKPDLICSFDVLEHIYNIESWIASLKKINYDFVLIFMTCANSLNPIIARRLRKLQIRSEYYGDKNNIRIGDSFSDNSFLKERQNIITNRFPELGNKDTDHLALRSRGLKVDDIEKMVKYFIETGETNYKLIHPTNTCDPYTGSWVEKLIDLKLLKNTIEKNNFHVEFHNSYYAYSHNRILNIPKYVLNQFIKFSGPNSFLMSPAFSIEIEKIK